MSSIKILNVRIDIIPKTDVLEKIKKLLINEDRGQCQLITTNPEFIVTAQHDEEFKNIINSAWLSVADGYGIRLAAKYQEKIKDQRSKIKNNVFYIFFKFLYGLQVAWWGITRNDKKLNVITDVITGTDLVPAICDITKTLNHKNTRLPSPNGEANGGQAENTQTPIKIFLFGGYGDTPKLAAAALLDLESPPFKGGEWVVNKDSENILISYATFEEPNIIEKINSFQPAILFVALNHPRAQKWINENLSKMPSVKLAVGVGGAFDYLSGKIKRAPTKWRGSFEWLFRLVVQPKRWKRIWQASVVFPWKVFIKY